MTLGILEDTKLEHVPGEFSGVFNGLVAPNSSSGTSFVYDDASRPVAPGSTDSRIKYDESGPVKIILVPQPSDDPNDPLVCCSAA
jgi:hypothetical protein